LNHPRHFFAGAFPPATGLRSNGQVPRTFASFPLANSTTSVSPLFGRVQSELVNRLDDMHPAASETHLEVFDADDPARHKCLGQ
jgi:hypothetical protein